mmetsp:Transcript_21091/g.30478  ORF Transcript_21091/g.30478 Transcript_21091/m.30478 type:complete len:673 (+) Transcript_21091:66-2084(+)
MGAGGSTALDSEFGRDSGFLKQPDDENSWLIISVSKDSADNFEAVHKVIKTDGDSSLLMKPEEFVVVNGYSWRHGEIARPEDDDKNLRFVAQLDEETKRVVREKCAKSGLYSKYVEIFGKPDNMDKDYIFIQVRFQVRTPENKNAETLLAGCLPKSVVGLPLDDNATGLKRGTWLSRAKELLPGDRFEDARRNVREWWHRIESVVDSASRLQATNAARSDFYVYSKRQSVAYQRLIAEGITSSEGEKLVADIERLKGMCHQAAHAITSTVLDSLFSKGEKLLCDMIHRNLDAAKEKLHALKKSLQSSFEVEIFNLAESLENLEAESWANLNERFQTDCSSAAKIVSSVNNIGHRNVPKRMESASEKAPSVTESETQEIRRSRSRSRSFCAHDTPSRRQSVSEGLGIGCADGGTPGALAMQASMESRAASRAPSRTVSHATSTIDDCDAEPHQKPCRRRSLSPRMTVAPLERLHSRGPVQTGPSNSVPAENGANAILKISEAVKKSTKAKLARRLALQRAYKSTQQDETFMNKTKFDFEFIFFSFLITQKMEDYMEKEYNLMENRMSSDILRELDDQAHEHSKSMAQAVGENRTPEEIEKLSIEHAAERTKLENKLTAKKKSKRKAFDDARGVTMGKLRDKLAALKAEGTRGQLSPAGIEKFKAILDLFKTLE